MRIVIFYKTCSIENSIDINYMTEASFYNHIEVVYSVKDSINIYRFNRFAFYKYFNTYRPSKVFLVMNGLTKRELVMNGLTKREKDGHWNIDSKRIELHELIIRTSKKLKMKNNKL